jgi:hypothetical protein
MARTWESLKPTFAAFDGPLTAGLKAHHPKMLSATQVG